MTEWIITAVAPNGEDREKTIEGSRADVEAKEDDLRSLGFSDIEIQPAGQEQASGGGVEVVEESPDEEIPDNPSVADDPIDWVPSHFVDEIQGVPAINRKGYAVLAEQYEIEVTREFVTYPSDTDFEYAEAEATAVTLDGRAYSGFGSASIERDDDPTLLGELAETRAIKRSLALATGVGMTAVSELKNEL